MKKTKKQATITQTVSVATFNSANVLAKDFKSSAQTLPEKHKIPKNKKHNVKIKNLILRSISFNLLTIRIKLNKKILFKVRKKYFGKIRGLFLLN